MSDTPVWCEHCRTYSPADHFDQDGLHRAGAEYGGFGQLLAAATRWADARRGLPPVPRERFGIRGAAHLVLSRGDRVLLTRRAGTGWADGCWQFPAGHFEGDEPATAVAAREGQEELGIAIHPAEVDVLHVMHRRREGSSPEYLDVFASPRRWQGEPRICEPDKCDGLEWFDLGKLPSATVGYVRVALHHVAGDIHYSEVGWGG